MPKATYGLSLSAGGVVIQETVSRDGDHPNSFEVPLPAAKSGPLSTRTDADTGVATLGSSHGILDSDTVDLYWDGGSRFDVDVTSVTGTTVALNGGSGDDLPALNSTIIVCKQVTIDATINGDALQVIGVELKYTNRNATNAGRAKFIATDDSTVVDLDLEANEPRIWDIAGGAENPFIAEGLSYPSGIIVAHVSHGNAIAAATLKIVSLEDSTP